MRLWLWLRSKHRESWSIFFFDSYCILWFLFFLFFLFLFLSVSLFISLFSSLHLWSPLLFLQWWSPRWFLLVLSLFQYRLLLHFPTLTRDSRLWRHVFARFDLLAFSFLFPDTGFVFFLPRNANAQSRIQLVLCLILGWISVVLLYCLMVVWFRSINWFSHEI